MTVFSIHPTIQETSRLPAATRIQNGLCVVTRDNNLNRTHGIACAHLGKLAPINRSHLRDLMDCFRGLIEEREPTASISPVILGLAESGIVPSFAMQTTCEEMGIESTWSCSSRIDNGGRRFDEPHSHAPHHYLPRDFLARQAGEVWIVEDEITTGRTLFNLLTQVHRSASVARVRVFSILDGRSSQDEIAFSRSCQEKGWDVEATSILRVKENRWQQKLADRPFSIQSKRQGNPRFAVGESIADALPALLSGELDLLQHITLSPWVVDGRAISSRQVLSDGYYVYNISRQFATQLPLHHT